MRRKTFTVDAESVQGNPSAEITFKNVRVRDWNEYIDDPDVTDSVMLQRHVASWSGIVDDNEKDLPDPVDDPGVLGELYVAEQQAITRLLWQGPDGASAKN